MRRLRALILDFDGVVVESNALKTEAFSSVFARFPAHADAMMAYHHANLSVPRHQKFGYLVTEKLGRPGDDPLIGELADAFSSDMLRRLAQCPWVRGAETFFEQVRGRMPMFVVSMTPEAELEQALLQRDLGTTFSRVYGCPPWTKEHAIADIVEQVGGRDGVVFVGDSAADQRAARHSGIAFIARDSGLPFDEPLPERYPDLEAIAAVLLHGLL